MKTMLAIAAILSLGLAPEPAASADRDADRKLRGEYLEARTCDVWVGACFANSETSEAGKQATVAWRLTEGTWKGVDLAGMGAVLLIDAKATLGDAFHSPLPVRNVLLLDVKASDEQLEALRDFVKTQMGELAGNVIEEALVPIELELDCCDKKGCAKLVAGELVRIETRCLHEEDRVCGHEQTYYPPLTNVLSEKLPAYTVEHTVKQTLLQREWNDRDSRSAFLGRFEIDSPRAAKRVDPAEIVAR